MDAQELQELKDLAELYDYTAERGEGVYGEQLENALNELEAAAPEQFKLYMYWLQIKAEVEEQTAKDLEKIEKQVKDLVKCYGQTWKSRLFTWVWGKGREKWNNDMVRGFILAHDKDPNMFMEPGEPTVTKRRNKVDKE